MQTNTTPTLQHSTTPSSDDPSELQTELTTINTRVTELAGLSTTVKTLEDQTAQLAHDIADVRRSLLAPRQAPSASRLPGAVTDDCARHLAARFIAHCARSN